MNITRIIAKNFYSYEHLEFDLTKKNGIILLEGKNGAGKSAFVEAVCWGLTGKTIRKSTEKSLIRKGANSCLIEVYLDGNVVIRRGRKPTLLEFIVDGEKKVGATTDITQGYINDHYNTNLNILLTSMFFGQSNNSNFLDATPDAKRNIIRSFLDLEDVFSYRDNIKNIKSDCTAESKAQKTVLANYQKELGITQEALDKIASDPPEEIESLSTLPSLDELEGQWTKFNEYGQMYSMYMFHIEDIKQEIEDHKSTDTCPTCGKEIEDGSDIYDALIDKLEHYEELSSNLTYHSLPVITLKEYRELLEVKREWKTISSKMNWYTDRLGDLKESIEGCGDSIALSNSTYGTMRFWEKAFSEKGMIKYIIGNILKFFNTRVACYLSYLTNSRIFLEFNKQLEEIVTISKQETPYISLSGGEKQKVNLAVLLALKDLLLFTNKTQSNLIFFDEVTNSLDEEGVIGLYQLLTEIKKDKSIIIITHNKYLKNLMDSSNVVTVTKEKGISKINGN